ncbi:serine/threonine-protein kinase [Pedococcus sp. 5OH_020]|uniref:serine/threonine-protein kinase n=1 Tax=Pedococcus sp. 5OH_020 TaxID=2989814 RepID=UPI0022E9CB50|nr:serine/threonine-protein kinase [Pedococcus sp. 5OH_020]
MQPQLIAGRYEVLRSIGSGGMGTVWLCRDKVLGREVAVKRVGALPGEPAAAARAMREARIAASLNDPHAVGVYDIVDEDDAHWLVMEYVEGQSLAEKIRDEGALPPLTVAAIGSAMAGVLARAHERGIVHRDIKPGNILIDRAGTPKISDFGIARAQADDQLTQTGFMTGTPGYLSPELVRGGDPTSASDVWALGATLYYAVEGHPPYEAQANPLATLQAIAQGRPRPMQHAGPLGGAIAAMMEPDALRRWDMRTASERLDRVAHGDRTLALPAGAVIGAAPTEVLPDPVESAPRTSPLPLAAPPLGAPAFDPTPYGAGPDDPGRPVPPDQQRGSGRGWVVALALLALLAALALAYVLTDGFGAGRDTPAAGQTTTVTSTRTQTQSASSSSSSSSSTSSSSTTKPTTTTSTTTSTTTTAASGKDAAAMQKFVRDYFKDVTNAGKRDDTFARLTPAMQARAGGRAGYEAFWSGIDSVRVGDLQANPSAHTVLAALTYDRKSGGSSREIHQLTLVDSGGSLLIDKDEKIG